MYVGSGGDDHSIGYGWLLHGSSLYFAWTREPRAADVTVLFRYGTDGGLTWSGRYGRCFHDEAFKYSRFGSLRLYRIHSYRFESSILDMTYS